MIFARIYDSVITKIQYALDYSGLIRKIKESYSVSDEFFTEPNKSITDESTQSDTTIYSVDKNITDESIISEEKIFDFEKPIEDIYEYTESIQNLDFYKNSFENVDTIETILFDNSTIKTDSIASTELFYTTPNLVLVEGPYAYDFVDPTYYDPYFEITDQIQSFLIDKGITDIPIITDNISKFDVNSVLNDRPIILDNLSYNLTTQFSSDFVPNVSDQPFLQLSLYLEEGSYEKSYTDYVLVDYYASEGFSTSESISV